MSFEDRIRQLPIKDVDMREIRSGNWYCTMWEDGVVVEVDIDGRERPHRPEVSSETVELLETGIEEQYPRIPPSAIDFDKILELVLDYVQEYFREMGCKIVTVDETGDGGETYSEVSVEGRW